jgi:hypothetical protein
VVLPKAPTPEQPEPLATTVKPLTPAGTTTLKTAATKTNTGVGGAGGSGAGGSGQVVEVEDNTGQVEVVGQLARP